MGTLDLLISKLRMGSYYQVWPLELRKRSEQALVQVISERLISEHPQLTGLLDDAREEVLS